MPCSHNTSFLIQAMWVQMTMYINQRWRMIAGIVSNEANVPDFRALLPPQPIMADCTETHDRRALDGCKVTD